MNHFFCGSSSATKTSKLSGQSAGKYLFPLAMAGTFLVSPLVSAQEAASFKLGETDLTPAVRIDYVSIDNLYRKPSNVVSGNGVLVKPELVWRADRRLLTLNAQYKGEYAKYSEVGLDYDNHDFRLRGYGEISSKQRLAVNVSLSKAAEEQGLGQTSTALVQLTDQIEVTSVSANVEYGYGASEARGNLRGGVVVGSVSYANLDQFTEGDDYSYVRPYGVFSLRLSPDTRVLAEARFATLDFDDNRRDRSQVTFLTGVELSSSSKLSGDARIGVVTASFDENSNDDTTEFTAEIGLEYAPVSFSRFGINFNRELQTVDQSSNNAGRSVNDDANILWIHDWSSRIQTQTFVSLSNTDRECPSEDDQTVGFGLEVNYLVRRWLQFGISGAQASRTVTACANTPAEFEELNYDRSVVGVHVRATL